MTDRAINSAVECYLHTVEVRGSNPLSPTTTGHFIGKSLVSPRNPRSFSPGKPSHRMVQGKPGDQDDRGGELLTPARRGAEASRRIQGLLEVITIVCCPELMTSGLPSDAAACDWPFTVTWPVRSVE